MQARKGSDAGTISEFPSMRTWRLGFDSPPGSGGVDATKEMLRSLLDRSGRGGRLSSNKDFVLEVNRPPRLRFAQPPRLIQAGSSLRLGRQRA
jgi:hypothetical protein